ncbi:MAG: glycogen/starch synthase [Prevotellaceae bacterium]|nr:glycogen/starch synthase [Prevotellaceae bacterium]
MKANRLLFITQEINPYVPEATLTDLGRIVPLGAIDRGREIRAFMPKWGNINERRNQLHEVIRLSGLNLTIDKVDHPLIIKVASLPGTRMQIYFIDNEDFFHKRLQECDAKGTEYTDNFERGVFFARSVLETVKKLRWIPDIIHCQGWMSSFVPIYMKTAYADDLALRNCRTVYTQSPNKLTLPTGERFDKKLELRSTKEGDFKDFEPSLTPKDMEKMAIKHADGVSFHSAEPDNELIEYARQLGKPILEGAAADPDKYVAFFDLIWGKGKKEAAL